jgi:PAS domain S-box-containing protein
VSEYRDHEKLLRRLKELEQADADRKRSEKALRESEERFRNVYETAPLAFVVWDINARVTDWNKKAEEIFKWSKDEVIGRTFFDFLISEEDRPRVEDVVKSLLSGALVSHSINKNLTKTGEILTCEWNNSALHDHEGHIIGAISLGLDITKRQQAEEELKKHRDHLEELVKARTSELLAAKEKAEMANIAKSDFLAHMSHELRTPLNAILGFSRLLERELSISKEQKDKLELIHTSGEHLLALINNILDMSKIEAGQVELALESFDPTDFIRDIAGVFHNRAAEKYLKFSIDRVDQLPRYIRCDQGKLRQALFNILANALKFTSKGGIRLGFFTDDTMAQDDPPHTRIYFEISDTGVGIESDQFEAIFTPFVQVGDYSNIKTGTGLGLAISRRFVRLMGGDISVKSRPGKGSTFTVMVPVQIMDKPDHPKQRRSERFVGLAKDQPECRVLVVDDNYISRFLLSELLQQVGIKVGQAEDGRRAVEAFKRWKPDLIFMDIRMPVMDGKAATRAIKATPRGRKTPIIAVTAHAFDDERKAILAAGCDDFISKPFDENELFNKLARHLNLQLIYTDEETEALDAPLTHLRQLTPERIEAIPSELIMALQNAAILLDMEATKSVIEKIRRHDRDMANALSRVLETFHFDKIIEVAGLHPHVSASDHF